MKKEFTALSVLFFPFVVSILLCLSAAPQASAYSFYFLLKCATCHYNDSATCNGCHPHGGESLEASTDKSTYAPGEDVLITLDGGEKYGWVRGMLRDENGKELARLTGPAFMGDDSGDPNEFPLLMQGFAPGRAGSHTWSAVYFGNDNGTDHEEIEVPVLFDVDSDAEVVVEAVPLESPPYISSDGGTLNFSVSVENTTSGSISFDVWIDATLPSGKHYGPVAGPISATLPGGASVTQDQALEVPGIAPRGVYSCNIYLGDYQGGVIYDADSFDLIKE